ncbi:hypothetical protein [Caenispirillum salinarum]|uniref:hypothetical protein n=1 Tax=Caenispirillum salinarum TaxID=859058 RepID=UPI00384C75C1
MEALTWGVALLGLIGFVIMMSCLRLPGLANRILIYEMASLLLVVEILLVGGLMGYEAARHIALVFLALSIIGGYTLVLRFWMLGSDGGEGGDRGDAG